MARQFQRREPLPAMSEINVTPLIDLAFALLIIFMITAPLLEQSIDLQLPIEEARPQSSETPVFVQIAVDEAGQLFLDGDPVTDADLEIRLAELAAQPEPPVIRIRGDARLAYQGIIDVIDLLKTYELNRISLETRAR